MTEIPAGIPSWQTIAERFARLVREVDAAQTALMDAPSPETLDAFIVALDRYQVGALMVKRSVRESDVMGNGSGA